MLTLLYFQFFSLSSAPVASIQQALSTELISSCPALALSGFHCRRCDANAPEHMVHMNMRGNDWERRHISVATFLASIMMREKIIWRMVGSIPPSLNDCTSRARPGAARMNAPRRGRPPLPCTRPCKGGAAAGRGSRRASPYRAGYGHLPGEVKKSWLAGWLGIYQDLLST